MNCTLSEHTEALANQIQETLKIASKKSKRIQQYWQVGQLLSEASSTRQVPIEELLENIYKDLNKENNTTPRRSDFRRMLLLYQYYPVWKVDYGSLNWSQLMILLNISERTMRNFYLEECLQNHWSAKELSRQINSYYYERIHFGGNNEHEESAIVKDTYVLEFLDMTLPVVERDLENALLDKLQDFLLELGRGFAFVARQKRIVTESGKHFYIDLVFYHFILKCFVLVDLKRGELGHSDIGQMDMYVRLYDDKWRGQADQPSLGIILCSEKDHTIVKYSVLNGSRQLYASRYQLYLPTEAEINAFMESILRAKGK